MKYLIVLMLLVMSCGKVGDVGIIDEGPESWLVFDKFCTVRIQKHTLRRMATGTRRLRIPDQDVSCRVLNASKKEYLSEVYNLEEVFEAGERVWILGDGSMDMLHKHLIENDLIERED